MEGRRHAIVGGACSALQLARAAVLSVCTLHSGHCARERVSSDLCHRKAEAAAYCQVRASVRRCVRTRAGPRARGNFCLQFIQGAVGVLWSLVGTVTATTYTVCKSYLT
eukprot:3055692-Prymnesium_polylepis.1